MDGLGQQMDHPRKAPFFKFLTHKMVRKVCLCKLGHVFMSAGCVGGRAEAVSLMLFPLMKTAAIFTEVEGYTYSHAIRC